MVLFVIQEKIKALQAELQAVTNSKTMLEKELQEVITLTSTELEEYQEKVLELEDEVNKDTFVSVCVTVFRFLNRTALYVEWEMIVSCIFFIL